MVRAYVALDDIVKVLVLYGLESVWPGLSVWHNVSVGPGRSFVIISVQFEILLGIGFGSTFGF